MNKDLSREDLLRLIRGHGSGSYSLAEFLEKRSLGKLHGFPNERWDWDEYQLSKISDEGLWALYEGMKNWVEPPPSPPHTFSPERLKQLEDLFFELNGYKIKFDKYGNATINGD